MSISVVAFVPMRHTSERVPGKNYRSFNGRPLFFHIVESLLSAESVERVVIDTDSELIVEKCAQDFPSVECISRPKHLLGGDVPMTSVLQHDASVVPHPWYLQTHSTNPLLTSDTIDRAVRTLEKSLDRHDSLLSVTRLQTRLFDAEGCPINHDPEVLLRTQDLPPVYEENSNLYVFTEDMIRRGRRTGERALLFEVDPLEAIDIDEEHDFVVAEILHRQLTGGVR